MACCSGVRDWDDALRVDDILPRVRTGDLFLFCGTGLFSFIIRLTSPAKNWSHTGMAIVIGGVPCISEANKGSVGVDVFRNTETDGVQCVKLRERLLSYDGSFVWIPMRTLHDGGPIPADRAKRLIDAHKRFIQWNVMPKYNMHLDDLFEYATRTDDDDNIHGGKHEEVCVTWVAHCFKIMGYYSGKCGNLLLADVAFGNMGLHGLVACDMVHLKKT